ncbi:MAG TPA: PfkB family carbohydrate kinase, partial [Deinococcales bacterium]|nr:PfkB family carbohydrate kinase [Deinococcales bacterium]
SGCSAAHTVVITLGEAGAWANCRGQVVTVPAVPTRVVDRPGAGDAFVAGVLSGLLGDDLQAGLHRGAALASRALAHRGDIVSVSRHDLGAGTDPESGGIRR